MLWRTADGGRCGELVRSLVRWWARSFASPFAHSLTRSLTRSLAQSLSRSVVQSLTHSLARSLARSLVCSLLCLPRSWRPRRTSAHAILKSLPRIEQSTSEQQSHIRLAFLLPDAIRFRWLFQNAASGGKMVSPLSLQRQADITLYVLRSPSRYAPFSSNGARFQPKCEQHVHGGVSEANL